MSIHRPTTRQVLRLSLLVAAAASLAVPLNAHAQEGSEADFRAFEDSSRIAHASSIVATDLHTTVVVPGRELTLSGGKSEVGAGVMVADDNTWVLPLSAANGFTDVFELGFDLDVVAAPFDHRSMLSNLKVRGKYTFIKDKLVMFGEFRIDGGLLNPTAQHLLLQVPWLLKLTPTFRLFAMATVALDYPRFSVSSGSRLMLNLTPMVHFTDQIFASLDTQLGFGITPNLTMPISDNALPIGLGAGYLLFGDNGAVRAVVTMDDVAPADGVERNFSFRLFYVKFIK